MRRFLIIAGPLSAVVGVVVAGFALYLGFQNNSQGEFFDVQTGSIDVWHSVEFFATGAFGATAATFVACAVVVLLAAAMRAALRRLSTGAMRQGKS